MAFASVANTYNQRQIAGVFDAAEATATGDLDTVIDALIFSSTPQALTAFDTASGEIHASIISAGLHQGDILSDAMLNRVRSVSAAGDGGMRPGLWLSMGVTGGSTDTDGNGDRIDGRRFGITGGIDLVDAGTGLTLGLAGGYSSGDIDADARLSKAEVDSWHAGAYARVGTGRHGVTADVTAAYSSGEADIVRGIVVNNLTRTARSRVDLDSFNLSGQIRYGFGGAGRGWAFGPVATIDYAHVRRGAFRESGADALDIVAASDSDGLTAYGVGGFASWAGRMGRFDISLLYEDADGAFTETRLALAGAPGVTYGVRSPNGADGALRANVTGDLSLGGGWGLSASYRGRMGSDITSHSVLITLHWRR